MSIDLTKIGILKEERTKIDQQLVNCIQKLELAQTFSEMLYQTREFALDFWEQKLEEARQRVKEQGESEYWYLEYQVEKKTKFDLYYQAIDLFNQEIKDKIKEEERKLENQLWTIDSEIEKLEKRLINNKSKVINSHV